MSRGLHLLGVDAMKTSSAVFSALAEGLAQGATHQRADIGPAQAQAAQAQKEQAQALAQAAKAQAQAAKEAKEASNTKWYVAGGAAVVALLLFSLLRRSR